MESDNVIVELYGETGSCSQGCLHCPQGGIAQPEALRFSQSGLAMLGKLQEYLKGRDDCLNSLIIPGGVYEKYDIAALPLDPLPHQVTLEMGRVFGESDVQAIADKTFELLERCIGPEGLPVGRAMSLQIDVVPNLDEQMGFENPDQLTDYYRQLLKGVVEKGWNLSSLAFSLTRNDLPAEAMERFDQSLEERYKVLMAMSRVGRDVLEKNFFKETGFYQYDNLTRTLVTQVDVVSLRAMFPVTFASRYIARHKLLDSPTPLSSENPRLMFLPDHVWVEHDPRHTRDQTVRMSYDEIGEIIDKAAQLNQSIGREINSRISNRRRLKRAGV